MFCSFPIVLISMSRDWQVLTGKFLFPRITPLLTIPFLWVCYAISCTCQVTLPPIPHFNSTDPFSQFVINLSSALKEMQGSYNTWSSKNCYIQYPTLSKHQPWTKNIPNHEQKNIPNPKPNLSPSCNPDPNPIPLMEWYLRENFTSANF